MSVLSELRKGQYVFVRREVGNKLILVTYRTNTGRSVQFSNHIFGQDVHVNGVKMGRLFSWCARRALRKGATAQAEIGGE